nr:hypothetical protein [Tanacetum cinerariifolium]
TDIDVKDQVKGVAEMNIVEEAEEEKDEKIKEQKADEELKADEEHQGDDQAGDEKEGFLSQQHIKRSTICFNLPPVILFLPTLKPMGFLLISLSSCSSDSSSLDSIFFVFFFLEAVVAFFGVTVSLDP